MGLNDSHNFVKRQLEQDYWCSRCGKTYSALTLMSLNRSQITHLFHYTQCWTFEESKADETDQARFVTWAGG